MHAIILAGGLGTRLRDTLVDLPKPMAPVGGRPFLEYLLRQLGRQGFADVLLCVAYRADAIRDHFGDGSALGLRLDYSVEDEPLGTAGALRLVAPDLPGNRWLLLNGDSYFGIAFAELAAAHERSGAGATIALRRTAQAERFGSVGIDERGLVTSFVEKAASGDGERLTNAGVYVVERSVIELIPAGRPVSLEREILPSLAGASLFGQEFDAPFVDIGLPEDYHSLAADPGAILDEL